MICFIQSTVFPFRVLHVPLELHSLKFVGFDEIADYHGTYVHSDERSLDHSQNATQFSSGHFLTRFGLFTIQREELKGH